MNDTEIIGYNVDLMLLKKKGSKGLDVLIPEPKPDEVIDSPKGDFILYFAFRPDGLILFFDTAKIPQIPEVRGSTAIKVKVNYRTGQREASLPMFFTEYPILRDILLQSIKKYNDYYAQAAAKLIESARTQELRRPPRKTMPEMSAVPPKKKWWWPF